MKRAMLVAKEIWAHPAYKERVLAANELDNRVVMKLFRDNHRVLDNEAARAVETFEAKGATDYEAYRTLVSGRTTRESIEIVSAK